jgi:hypothetical protein
MPTQDDIDDRIDLWHSLPDDGRPLHEALGWTRAEYDRWIVDAAQVPDRPLPIWP